MAVKVDKIKKGSSGGVTVIINKQKIKAKSYLGGEESEAREVVGFDLSYTINMGDFQSTRIGIYDSRPVEEDREKTLQEIKEWVKTKMAEEMKDALAFFKDIFGKDSETAQLLMEARQLSSKSAQQNKTVINQPTQSAVPQVPMQVKTSLDKVQNTDGGIKS